MKLKISPEEALKIKFIKTISTLAAFEGEAFGDVGIDQDWTAPCVLRALKNIRCVFEADLAALQQEVRVSPRRDNIGK